jgi:hypothetical protein
MHYYGPIHSTSRSVRASGRLYEVLDKSRECHVNAIALTVYFEYSSLLFEFHLFHSFNF